MYQLIVLFSFVQSYLFLFLPYDIVIFGTYLEYSVAKKICDTCVGAHTYLG